MSNVHGAALPFSKGKTAKPVSGFAPGQTEFIAAPECKKAVSVYLDVTRLRWLDSCLQPRRVFPPVFAALGVLMPHGAEVRAWGGWAGVRRAGAEPQYSHLIE